MIFRYYHSVQHQEWTPASYGTPPFAAAVMQRTLPFISSSSSSLALALGDPSKPSTSSVAPRPQPQYQPQESAQFFDTFVAETSQEVVAQQAAPAPLPPVSFSQSFTSDIKTPVKEIASVPGPPVSSPDPLVESARGLTTPRKRKPEELSSPSLKRIQNSRVQHEKSASSQSTSHIGATPNKRLSVFVEVPSPPKGWLTPSTAGRSFTKSAHYTGTSDDLGGFSPPPESDWEEDQTGHRSGSKSTGRRTGDRDERGEVESYFSFSYSVTHV